MRTIILEHHGLDVSWVEINPDGSVTRHPGNQGGGPWALDEFTKVVQVLKHASEIKEPELRRSVVKAAYTFLPGNPVISEILGPGGNIIAIF